VLGEQNVIVRVGVEWRVEVDEIDETYLGRVKAEHVKVVAIEKDVARLRRFRQTCSFERPVFGVFLGIALTPTTVRGAKQGQV
jgi:hypothetical protein